MAKRHNGDLVTCLRKLFIQLEAKSIRFLAQWPVKRSNVHPLSRDLVLKPLGSCTYVQQTIGVAIRIPMGPCTPTPNFENI